MGSPAGSTKGSFGREIGRRLHAFWLAKAAGLGLGMTGFFMAYFRVLKHPVFSVTVMPLTAVDRFVEFRPEALPLYLSLWIYVPLAFALLKNRRELLSSAMAAVGLSAIGLGLFFFWPTAVPDVARDWSMHPAFAFLKSVDASGNACPSLHVAFAVFTAVRLGRVLREIRGPAAVRVGNWLWCLAIVYSTLATGQHVAIDALAGAVLGTVVAVIPFGRSDRSSIND